MRLQPQNVGIIPSQKSFFDSKMISQPAGDAEPRGIDVAIGRSPNKMKSRVRQQYRSENSAISQRKTHPFTILERRISIENPIAFKAFDTALCLPSKLDLQWVRCA